MEKQPIVGPGHTKVQEYIDRIKNGESKDSIMQGLPPSFVSGIEAGLSDGENENKIEPVSEKGQSTERHLELDIPPQYQKLDADTLEFIWTIPEYVDREKTAREKERKQKAVNTLRGLESGGLKVQERKLADETKIEEIRGKLGIGSGVVSEGKKVESSLIEKSESESGENHLLAGLVKYVSQGRSRAAIEQFNKLLGDIENDTSRKQLAQSLFGYMYDKYREGDYPFDPNEEQTWEYAHKNNKVEISTKNSDWVYRGVFPKQGQETLTRGSFNVNVTPDLIDKLDDMIATGKIKANYKFGQPDTKASPMTRHDSISIYFLEQPTDEVLLELGQVIKPYVRGDNLLGKKIEDGFFISEIGSIETEHIESFVEELKLKDAALADAVKFYTSPKQGQGTKLKMSEAQFYAIKDVARAFGYNISYDKDAGFGIQ